MCALRCLVLFLLSVVLPAQDLQVKAASEVLQGNTLRIELQLLGPVSPAGWSAEFRGRRVPLYPDGPGRLLGLMPVSATDEPGADTLVVRNSDNRPRFRQTVEVKDAKFRVQNIRATSRMQSLKPMPGEMEAIRALQDLASPERYWTEPFVAPTPQCMNSPFGVQRHHNGKPTGNFHRGVDYRSPEGTPVLATAAGTVQIAKMFRMHGGTVGLDHGQGLSSVYIHLSKLAVKEGATVRQGDVVGYVGSTGFATGPHLHWGLYVNGLPVNPLQWIPEIRACR